MLCVTPRNSSVMSADNCGHRCSCSEAMIKTASDLKVGINLVTISWFWKQVPLVSSLVIPHDRSPRQRGNSWRLWHHEAFEAHTQIHTHANTHTHTHTHTTTDTHTHKSQDVSLRADSISRRFLEVDSVHEFVFGFQRWGDVLLRPHWLVSWSVNQ